MYRNSNTRQTDNIPYGDDLLDRVNKKLRNFGFLIQSFNDSDRMVLSPQLLKRLTTLTNLNLITSSDGGSIKNIVTKIASVINRLIMELNQVHYNTKQREQDFIRLVNSKGCSINDPSLTDEVLNLLLKIHKAADQCIDTSFEREVLIKFLEIELVNYNCTKRQLRRIVQTLYACSCFEIIEGSNRPGKLRLKDELSTFDELRLKHDLGLIKMAQAEYIRLPPESWSFILYGNSYPETTSKIQSILDKYQRPVEVSELEYTIKRVGDKYNLQSVLPELKRIQNLITECNKEDNSKINHIERIDEILSILLNMENLFTIRQSRSISNR